MSELIKPDQELQSGGEPNNQAQIVETGLDQLEDDDDDDEGNKKKSSGARERRKIEIRFIQEKSRRHITFSKRKAGIMKKAYELSVLTGTQVLLLVVSETGLVYTFTTPKLQPLVTKPEGKNLIQTCLNAPEESQQDDEEDQNQSVTPQQQQQQQQQQQNLPPPQQQQIPQQQQQIPQQQHPSQLPPQQGYPNQAYMNPNDNNNSNYYLGGNTYGQQGYQ